MPSFRLMSGARSWRNFSASGVAAVRHLWNNASDMVAELTRLRGQVQTYREMAEKRGDLLEACRAELRDAKKRA